MALRLLSKCHARVVHRSGCPEAILALQHATVHWPRCKTDLRATSREPMSETTTTTSSSSSIPSSRSRSSGDDRGPAELPQHRTIIPKLQSKFCRMCGGAMDIVKPDGDKEWRHVCGSCGYIDYFNPKMVVGCVVQHEGKILLCKRAIEPCKGKWTVPAGFMEIGESTAAGAARETLEEANAAVQILAPYAHWDIPVIGQTYILFRAQLAPPYTFAAGPESLEVALFDSQNIPFDQIAFSSVGITLRHYIEDMQNGSWHLHHGVIDKKPNSLPNDPAAFELRDHFAVPVATPGSGQE